MVISDRFWSRRFGLTTVMDTELIVDGIRWRSVVSRFLSSSVPVEHTRQILGAGGDAAHAQARREPRTHGRRPPEAVAVTTRVRMAPVMIHNRRNKRSRQRRR